MAATEVTFESALFKYVTDAFQTMLLTETAPGEPLPSTSDLVTATVSIGGTWKGALIIKCASPQAILFAQRFLQDESICEVNDEVTDTMGELANILAGNMKSVLPTGMGLGAPSVIVGNEYQVYICGARTVVRCNFSSDAGPFSVELMKVN